MIWFDMIYLHTRVWVCGCIDSSVSSPFTRMSCDVIQATQPQGLLVTCLICAKLNCSMAPSLRTWEQFWAVHFGPWKDCALVGSHRKSMAQLPCVAGRHWKGDGLLAQIRITWEIERTWGTCSTAFVHCHLKESVRRYCFCRLWAITKDARFGPI